MAVPPSQKTVLVDSRTTTKEAVWGGSKQMLTLFHA